MWTCQSCIPLDEKETDAHYLFRNPPNQENNPAYEGTKYHQRACKKVELFLRNFENVT